MTQESLTHRDNKQEPFAFWLVRLFLALDEQSDEEFQPMSNQEFYAMSALILTAYALYAMFLGPLRI